MSSSDSSEPPAVYIIAGPNGAGKMTFATDFLPKFVNCRQFLNADLIAAGLAPFAPETQNVRAGRLLQKRIDELVAAKSTFGFETTLSGRTYLRLLKRMKAEGYSLFLFFLWLPTADLAVTRVAQRVSQGGHNIPETVIQRRFESGLYNLFHVYRPLLNTWWLYDASRLPPAVIAKEEGGQLHDLQPKLLQAIINYVDAKS